MDHVGVGDDRLDFLEFAPPPLRRAIEGKARILRAMKGRTIVGVGARTTDVFFVVEGEVQILLYSSNGREVSIRFLGQGDSFGELAALDGLPRSASVVAASDVRLRLISRDDFLSCLETSPRAALWLARRLGGDVRRLTERVFELSALNVQARLHCELLRLARRTETGTTRVSPAPTHAELANRIGTHREAVTREMRALAQMNIIRNYRRSLEFLDLAGLERVVNRAIGDMGELNVAG